MSRSVEPCDRVTHIHQTEQECEPDTLRPEGNHGTAWVTREVRERPQAGDIQLYRTECEQADDENDGEGKDQIAAKVCYFSGDFDAIMIQERLGDQHHSNNQELMPVTPGGRIHLQGIGEQNTLEKDCIQQYIYRGNHADQTNEVEPGGC